MTSAVRRKPKGCSGVFAAAFVILAAAAIAGWPIFLDARGTAAPAVIVEKRETIRTEYSEWFRHFEILASYSVPGQSMERRAVCDVDEKTYDSLHRGDTVIVHYFRNLLVQPFVPAAHLSPCTTLGAITLSPSMIRSLALCVGSLLLILMLWNLGIRFAAWLFLLWLVLSFLLLVLPRPEPEPQRPLPATATVENVVTISTVGQGKNSEGLGLLQPYQLVQLKFTPSGMDTPVEAIDKIDEDSAPDLKVGQSVQIVYDGSRPRVVRLLQGTRRFPMDALVTVVLCCFGLIAIFAIWGALRRLFRPLP